MRLKELREQKMKITQLKMAIDLNMNQNILSRYKNGKQEPSITELIKIADYFDVSIDYILERTNNTNINK